MLGLPFLATENAPSAQTRADKEDAPIASSEVNTRRNVGTEIHLDVSFSAAD